MAEKIYIGRVKAGKFDGSMMISLGPNDFEKLSNARNDKGWVNLFYSTCRNPTPEKPGYLCLANGAKEAKKEEPASDVPTSREMPEDDLPF